MELNSGRIKLVLILLYLTGILLALHIYSGQTTEIPIHFDAAGQPDGWASPTEFFLIQSAIFTFLLILFLGIARLTDSLNIDYFNIPNKNYWKLDENQQTARELTGYFLYLTGALTFGFLITLNFFLYIIKPQNGSYFWLLLIIYLVLLIIMILKMYRMFSPGKT